MKEGEHIVNLCYRTTEWILMKLDMVEELKAFYMFKAFAQIRLGTDRGRGENRLRGLLQKKTSVADGYSNTPNA